VALANLQIFGTKKCAVTRQAERFFKERRVAFHLIDIAQKAPSPGELRKIANAVGGMDKLIDRTGKRYVDRGLKYAAPTGPRIEQILLDDPLLLITPIVRAGDRATVGLAEATWAAWIAALGRPARYGLGTLLGSPAWTSAMTGMMQATRSLQSVLA
jgi:arsenate reductase